MSGETLKKRGAAIKCSGWFLRAVRGDDIGFMILPFPMKAVRIRLRSLIALCGCAAGNNAQ